MTQLHSSFQTVMQRRVVPAFMIVLNAGVFLRLLIPRAAPFRVICIAAVIQMIVCLVYYLTYQKLVSPAAESVVYENGALRVRRHGREVSIPVASIAGIRGRLGLNPETVTLDLSESTALGSSVTFIPPARFPSIKEHPMMAALRELIGRPEGSKS
ncbi:MAG: hypothetical protein J0L73_04480 [Verrucomicrobia bacterium]|nr:hypothetical protein [Verrucomicrobiota bacterium]